MAPYRPDCDSNDCELPSGQATPSILARGVACEAAALPFSAAYHPIAARSSGVKEALYFFAFYLAWHVSLFIHALTLLQLLGSPL